MKYQAGDEPVPGFVLTERLGRGGFGVVWRATSPGGGEVAVKSIDLQSGCGDKELQALQLVKLIRHPNMVPFTGFWLRNDDGRLLCPATEYDDAANGLFGESVESTFDQDTLVYDTMVSSTSRSNIEPIELIAVMGLGDESLSDRLERARSDGHQGIPPAELIGYMRDAARAIDFLNSDRHQASDRTVAIQHCDIKPQNILVVGGSAQICDLGLARVLDDAKQTRAVFSPAYAAPECLSGTIPSRGTDQYSLAISYVELRTGSLPFKPGATNTQVVQAHLKNQLDLSRLSVAEQRVIQKATSLQPRRRYDSALDMVEALNRALLDRPDYVRRSRRRFAAASVAVGVGCLLMLGFGWRGSSVETTSTEHADSITESAADGATGPRDDIPDGSLHVTASTPADATAEDSTIEDSTTQDSTADDSTAEDSTTDIPNEESPARSSAPVAVDVIASQKIEHSETRPAETGAESHGRRFPTIARFPLLEFLSRASMLDQPGTSEPRADARATDSPKSVSPESEGPETERSAPAATVDDQRTSVEFDRARTAEAVAPAMARAASSSGQDERQADNPTELESNAEDSQADDGRAADLRLPLNRNNSTGEKPRAPIKPEDYSAVLRLLAQEDRVSGIHSSVKLTLEPERRSVAQPSRPEATATPIDQQLQATTTEQRQAQAAKHLRAGTNFVIDGLLDAAIGQYSIAARLAEDPVDALRLRGVAYAKTARFELALADLNRSLELKPDPVALRLRALVHLARQDYSRALEDQAAMKRFPDVASMQLMMKVGAEGANVVTEDQRIKLVPLQSVELMDVRGPRCQIRRTTGGESLVGWVRSDLLTPIVAF